VRLRVDRIKYWLGVGAQPSDRVAYLLWRAGLMPEPPIRFQTQKSKSKQKAEGGGGEGGGGGGGGGAAAAGGGGKAAKKGLHTLASGVFFPGVGVNGSGGEASASLLRGVLTAPRLGALR
jgi:hypothetical protein